MYYYAKCGCPTATSPWVEPSTENFDFWGPLPIEIEAQNLIFLYVVDLKWT